MFDNVAQPIVNEVLKGFNCTIFAYGQTGTGKTYTMEGYGNDSAAKGMIPRCVETIFDYLESHTSEYNVVVSCIELYNEEVMDLMKEGPKLLLKQTEKGLLIDGLEERTVGTAAEIYTVLDTCQSRRKTSATAMNDRSSRSHCITTLKIYMKEPTPDGEDLIKVWNTVFPFCHIKC